MANYVAGIWRLKDHSIPKYYGTKYQNFSLGSIDSPQFEAMGSEIGIYDVLVSVRLQEYITI